MLCFKTQMYKESRYLKVKSKVESMVQDLCIKDTRITFKKYRQGDAEEWEIGLVGKTDGKIWWRTVEQGLLEKRSMEDRKLAKGEDNWISYQHLDDL